MFTETCFGGRPNGRTWTVGELAGWLGVAGSLGWLMGASHSTDTVAVLHLDMAHVYRLGRGSIGGRRAVFCVG